MAMVHRRFVYDANLFVDRQCLAEVLGRWLVVTGPGLGCAEGEEGLGVDDRIERLVGEGDHLVAETE